MGCVDQHFPDKSLYYGLVLGSTSSKTRFEPTSITSLLPSVLNQSCRFMHDGWSFMVPFRTPKFSELFDAGTTLAAKLRKTLKKKNHCHQPTLI